MRTITACLLGVLLVPGPLLAQQPKFSLARAAREEAVKQAQESPRGRAPMSSAYMWTGIGLMIGGAAMMAGGVLVDNACVDEGDHSPSYCDDLQTAWFAGSGAVLAAGGAVLIVGNSRRSSAPSLSFGPKRVQLKVRF